MVNFLEDIADADQIRFIYETAFPEHRIQLHFVQTDSVVPPRARVFMGDSPRFAGDTAAGYLGAWRIGSNDPAATVVNAFIYLPRAATAYEWENHGQDGIMRSKVARAIFSIYPLGISKLRYFLRQRHEKRAIESGGAPRIHGGPIVVDATTSTQKPRPAILIGFHWLEHGGAEKLGYDTVNWALEAGLRVFVVSQNDGLHRLADRLGDHPDVQFIRIDRYIDGNSQFPFLRHLIVNENIKLIHNHHCTTLYAALPMLRLANPDLKVISSTHVWEYGNGGFVGLDGQWADFIDTHHVISRQIPQLLAQKFDVTSGIELGRLLDNRNAQDALPELRLSSNSNKITFAFVGRMSYQKDPILLVYIIQRLHRWARKNNIATEFEILGEGPLLPPVKALVARLKLKEVTKFHLADADVAALMKRADILLLPSENEGLALVCYEAIESGAIPICSDVGGQSELIPEGLLFDALPRKAINQCVDIVDRLVKDPAFLANIKIQLQANYNTIKAEPSAYDVLMPRYLEAAKVN